MLKGFFGGITKKDEVNTSRRKEVNTETGKSVSDYDKFLRIS